MASPVVTSCLLSHIIRHIQSEQCYFSCCFSVSVKVLDHKFFQLLLSFSYFISVAIVIFQFQFQFQLYMYVT